VGVFNLSLEEIMSAHITKEEFYSIIDNDGMFKIKDVFFGTALDFQNCVCDNVNYQTACMFAEENNAVVEEYTIEEHLIYMLTRRTS
jgi:hypothetical protein